VRRFANQRSFSTTRLGLSLILLATSACASMRRGDLSQDDTDIVTVNVINHHQLNVTIFNVASGRRDRIGEVTAAASSSFKVHLRRLANREMQLMADPIGSSRTTRTELLRVDAGDTVSWFLETDLARSHVEIH
jgi:hypothetical protein